MFYKKNLIPLYLIINELLKQAKVGFIIGFKLTFFSFNQCFMPLIGLWSSSGTTAAYFIIKALTGYLFFGSCLTLYIPTFFASIYLSSPSRLFRISIPAVSIILFLLKFPNLYFYPLYWLTPIIIGLVNPRSIFLRALGSTFTAHSVGTVIWAYWGIFPADHIYQLASVVWLERIVFAIGMTIIYKCVNLSYMLSKNKKVNGATIQ